ncbi:MAG: two pore domain potassium channel family protein [Proteobacteria bacterium]|nr:two pore domain potassium channel family protein [Pseudomonadota bacterium]
MITTLFIATALITISVIVHYETLRLISAALPRLTIPLRMRVIVVVFACLTAHTAEVWIYAGAYWLLVEAFHYGRVTGDSAGEFMDYLYFSTVTYTTLGFGEIYPQGPIRMIAAIEAMTGLLMVSWSASFTYLTMERFWPLHRVERYKR